MVLHLWDNRTLCRIPTAGCDLFTILFLPLDRPALSLLRKVLLKSELSGKKARHDDSVFLFETAALFRKAAALFPKTPGQTEVIARTMQAFASTAFSRINGSIPPAFMKKDSANRKEIELIHAA